MRKITYSIITLVLCFVLAGVAATQDTLTVGEPVEGEITDSIFTVEYRYEGSADEVIRVILDPVDAPERPAAAFADSARPQRRGTGAL